MKKHKYIITSGITLSLSLVLYGISLSPPLDESLLKRAPNADSWEPPSFTKSEPSSEPWVAPTAQHEDGFWLYDIFTPPGIYFDEKRGRFIARDLFEDPDSCLVLDSFERIPYRIQFSAWVSELDYSDPQGLLYCSDTANAILVKAGDHCEAENFTVLAFDYILKESHGATTRVARITLYDRHLGKEVVLTSPNKASHSDWVIHCHLASDSDSHYAFRAIGDSFKINDVSFTMLDFDPERETATIEKSSSAVSEILTLACLH